MRVFLRYIFILFISFYLISCLGNNSHNRIVNESENLVYYNQIHPIIIANCTPCHNSNGMGPFNLLNCRDFNKHAAMITEVVERKIMPPWVANHHYRSFKNERVLTQEEIDLILTYVDSKQKCGTKSDLTYSYNNFFEDIADTTISLQMSESYHHPGDGEERYKVFPLSLNINSNYWIKGIEIVPGNKKMVHHAWVLSADLSTEIVEDSSDMTTEFKSEDGFQVFKPIIGYLPGMGSHNFGEGFSKYLDQHSELYLQLHYYGSPIKQSDQTKVLLHLSKSPTKHLLQYKIITEDYIDNGPLFIPANSKKQFNGHFKIDKDINLYSIIPHMHFRGKSITVYAIKPHQTDTIPLIQIPNWDFDWQGMYLYDKHIVLPKGSTIYYTALFDNTVENFSNPVIPPIDVVNGESSRDEMLQIVLEYYEK